jgi:hypothetical protein
METTRQDPSGPQELTAEEMAALSGGALLAAGVHYYPPSPVGG